MTKSNFTSFVTNDDCLKILENSNPGAKLLDFELSPLGETPMGFLGEHFCLNINYTINGSKDQLKLFIKTLPVSNVNQYKYVQEMEVFGKETLLYKNVLVELLKISTVPFAASTYLIKPHEYLILENLQIHGFDLAKCENLDFEHCEALLKTMARFHAASIIYEENKSVSGKPYRIIDNHKEELKEGTFVLTKGHPRQKWIDTTSKTVINCIKLLPEYENKVEFCTELYNLIHEIIPKFIKPSKKYRNVVCHDDLWRNNLMFKKNNNGMECLLVDFQLARYAPPAFDFLTALYLNTEKSFFDTNFTKFIDIYYTTFSSEMAEHNINSDVVFSKTDFLASIEDYRLPALIESTFYGTNVYISDELASKIVSDKEVFSEFAFINRSKYVCKEFQEDQKFRRRLCNVLIPLIECAQN